MNLAGYILRRFGWKFTINGELPARCVVCVAPHTSNWDFIIGELCIRSVGKTASFLMKDAWFFFPLGYLLKAIGGIPVSRRKSNHVTTTVVNAFNQSESLLVAVTPEGTRSRNAHWHKGFLYIAHEAKVPIVMGCINYKTREVVIEHPFTPTDDPDADMALIKRYYAQRADAARYPEKFTTE